MKAVFYWIDGPLAGQMLARSGPRIPLGALAEDGVPVPGQPQGDGCAFVFLKDGHYFVQDRCTPGGLLADGRPVPPGKPVEVRGGTTLRFGPDGPGMRFGFEVEVADLIGRDAGRRVTPTQVMRRSALSFGGFDGPEARRPSAPPRRSRRWAVALSLGFSLLLAAMLGGLGQWVLQPGKTDVLVAPASAAVRLLPVASPIQPAAAPVPAPAPATPPDVALSFQQVFEAGAQSMVYLRVKWELEHQGAKHELTATGTGFVIDRHGHVVTAKHVVHPWKFRGIHVKLAHEGIVGWSPTGKLEIQAWRIGDRIGPDDDEEEGEQHSPRWSSSGGTVRVCAHEDHSTRTNVLDGTGLEHWALLDADPSRDVILLQITEDAPPPLEVVSERTLEAGLPALEPVVAVGFPLGTRLFEEQRVVPSPALGYVRKHERLIYHTAPVMPGNSGGPLLDREGRVVGLVNGMYSDQQNLTVSVSAMRIHELLRRKTCGQGDTSD